jgi:hypothetical protein
MDKIILIYLFAFIIVDVSLRLALMERLKAIEHQTETAFSAIARKISPTAISLTVILTIAFFVAPWTGHDIPVFALYGAGYFGILGASGLYVLHRNSKNNFTN